jgi:glycyl-tRNA synthetase
MYEEKDSIGRRYRRQDAIGTPFCITVDHKTPEDEMVTIRYRDSMDQDRIPVKKVTEIVQDKINMRKLLQNIK